MSNKFGLWTTECNPTTLLAVTKCDAGRQYQLRRKKITCSLTVKKLCYCPSASITLLNPEIYLDYILNFISPCVENELHRHYKHCLVNFVEKIIAYRRVRKSRKEPISLVMSVRLSHISTRLSLVGDPWNFILGSLMQNLSRNSILD
jgi:hypothetical protein